MFIKNTHMYVQITKGVHVYLIWTLEFFSYMYLIPMLYPQKLVLSNIAGTVFMMAYSFYVWVELYMWPGARRCGLGLEGVAWG